MAGPRILMLDEPSLGPAPRIAHRGFVPESGRVVLSGTGAELIENQRVREAYLRL
jgi:branched-chain amino acid transport system ATP-binding protein